MRQIGLDKKKPAKRTKRFVVFGIILIVLALAAAAYITMFHAPSASSEICELAVSSADEAYYYSNKLYYIKGASVVGKRDGSPGEIFSFATSLGEDASMCADGASGIIFAYNAEQAVALDMNGSALFTIPASDYNILSACVGGGNIAVRSTLGDKEYLRVFNKSGVEIYRVAVENTLMDYSLASNGELAVTTLDTTGISEKTSVMCYNPSAQANTANLAVYNQLTEGTVLSGNIVCMLGTTYMYAYTKQGNLNADALVYSLTCSDYVIGSDGTVSFAYLSRDATVSGVRLLSSSGEWSIIFTPAGVTKALIGSDEIYCFTDNEIYIYTLSTGQLARTIETDFTISDVTKSGSAAIIASDSGAYYYLALS